MRLTNSKKSRDFSVLIKVIFMILISTAVMSMGFFEDSSHNYEVVFEVEAKEANFIYISSSTGHRNISARSSHWNRLLHFLPHGERSITDRPSHWREEKLFVRLYDTHLYLEARALDGSEVTATIYVDGKVFNSVTSTDSNPIAKIDGDLYIDAILSISTIPHFLDL